MIFVIVIEIEMEVVECFLMVYYISFFDFFKGNDFKFYFYYDWGFICVWFDFFVIIC